MASTEVELKPAHASASEITPDSVSAWAGAGLGLARARARAIDKGSGEGYRVEARCWGCAWGSAQRTTVKPSMVRSGATSLAMSSSAPSSSATVQYASPACVGPQPGL